MKKLYFVGNWKMNLGREEAKALCSDLVKSYPAFSLEPRNFEVVVAPQFLLVPLVQNWVQSSGVQLACQNCASEVKGAFTGEVSPQILLELAIPFVILGHSERRTLFHETNAEVFKKIQLALQFSVKPIVCVGETEKDRNAGQEWQKVEEQLEAIYASSIAKDWPKIILAYEPLWAIGTGKVATPKQVDAMHQKIKNWVQKKGSEGQVKLASPFVLYGGSVKPENAAELVILPGVDGFLIGGASLNFTSFQGIIQNSCKVA